MFLSIEFVVLFSFVIIPKESDSNLYCPNGRPAFWIVDAYTFNFSTHCSTPGKSCYNKLGKCNKQHVCCPRTLKMSSNSRLSDQATGVEFLRIGDDHKHTYRLYELKFFSNTNLKYDEHLRWLFFVETLRDLFEMPNARFWYPLMDCMRNNGLAYSFVPLNATSVTSNISAMTILTRRIYSLDSIYVCYMVTKKEHRRQGLGTRLLQQIVQRAFDEQRNGVRSVTMHVNTLNLVALELYERCGWRCYQYQPAFLDPEPHHATNHAYALILYLDNVKNVTGLCRDPNAVRINHSDNEQSIKNCQRVPV